MSGETTDSDDDNPAWAVWLRNQHDEECIALKAESEDAAREKAIEESDLEPESVNIDGPFPDCEPAYFEFEYITEHREVVTVEAPYEDYAKETAELRRNHRGQYKRTVHTNTHRVPKESDADAE